MRLGFAAVSRLGRCSLHYSFQRRLRFLRQPSFRIACGEILEELDRREPVSISAPGGDVFEDLYGSDMPERFGIADHEAWEGQQGLDPASDFE
jgi:hypothetical protein